MITIQKANSASNVTIPNKVRISSSYRTTPFYQEPQASHTRLEDPGYVFERSKEF